MRPVPVSRSSRLGRVLLFLLIAALPLRPAAEAEAAASVQGSVTTTTVAAPIPPGFDPVTTHRDPEGPLRVRVWGREYVFADGPLPTEVRSLGQRIFSDAPRFELNLDDGPTRIIWSPSVVLDRSQRSVRLRATGRAGAARIESQTTIEYDGMIRVRSKLGSAVPVELDRFRYAFQFDAKVARFFNRHLEYDYRTMRVKRVELLETAGPVPTSPMRLPFVPTLSLGNREVGFEWWSDSDADWRARGRGRASTPIELVRVGNRVGLSIEPIASPLRLGPNRTWEHEFAIFVFPMRPTPDRLHAYRFIAPGEARHYEQNGWVRPLSIFFPGQFDARWHGLPASIDSDKQKKLRKRLARLGVGYVPYAKLTAAPSLHPKSMARVDQWSAAGAVFRGPAGGERKFLKERGWKPGTPFSYAACATEKSYFDWILEESLATVRDESPAALYYDWGSIMEPCRQRGSGGQLAWGYFELRDFYRRLYEAVKAIDPDVLVTIHTHGQPRAIGAFVDYVFIGEALNVVFRDARPFREIRADAGLYKPHYMDLPDGFLDAQIFPRTGGATALLPEVHFARDEKNPRREVALTREMFAETLVGGVPVWLTNCDVSTRSEIMSAVDRFGTLDEARLRPWWEDPLRVAGTAGVRGSVYEKEDAALLVVANRKDQPVRLTLKPDLTGLGMAGTRQFQDPEQPSSAPRPIDEKGIALSIPARDFRLVLIR